MTNFRDWPSWQRVVAIAMGICAVLTLVRLPEPAGAECKAPLPYRLACTAYGVASDVTDAVTSTSKTGKNTAKAVENTSSGVASTTEGAAKLLDKANKGIDGLGQWWKDAQARRAATANTAPLPPIHVIPVVPNATTSTTSSSPTSRPAYRGPDARHVTIIVGPNGERWQVK